MNREVPPLAIPPRGAPLPGGPPRPGGPPLLGGPPLNGGAPLGAPKGFFASSFPVPGAIGAPLCT